MNCLDCSLPVLGNGDRHRTSDGLNCHRVKGWEADAHTMLLGGQVDPESSLYAAAWYALDAAGGDDAAFDGWAKRYLRGDPSYLADVTNVYQLAVHYEDTLSKWAKRDAVALLKATARRLTVEAAMNRFLGHEHGVEDIAYEAVRASAEVDAAGALV